MKLVVPIKRVPDPYSSARPTADGVGVEPINSKFEINPFDEIALEQAIQLKEAGKADEVVVVSFGAAECEEQLRKALAMGADRAILFECEGQLDSLNVAGALAEFVKSESPQLVLMGKQATDFDRNQTGPRLAAILGWPIASNAAALELTSERAVVQRETDDGVETVEVSLPAVVTSDLRLAEPRYVALPGIIKARSKPLQKSTWAGDETSLLKTRSIREAPARTGGIKVGSVSELLDKLQSKGVVIAK